MSNYFTKITKHLNLKPNFIIMSKSQTSLTIIIDGFENHESIQNIKLANMCNNKVFSFTAE